MKTKDVDEQLAKDEAAARDLKNQLDTNPFIEVASQKYNDKIEQLKDMPEDLVSTNNVLMLRNIISQLILPVTQKPGHLEMLMDTLAINFYAMGYEIRKIDKEGE
jgi:hypothetical protein